MKETEVNHEKSGREWLLLIIGLPAITLVAGIFTLYIAIKYSDEVVDENVTRFGIEINNPSGQNP